MNTFFNGLLAAALILSVSVFSTSCNNSSDDSSTPENGDTDSNGDDTADGDTADDDTTGGDTEDDNTETDTALSTIDADAKCPGGSAIVISGNLDLAVDSAQWGPYAGSFLGGCGDMMTILSFCERGDKGGRFQLAVIESKVELNKELEIVQSGSENEEDHPAILRLYEQDAVTLNPTQHPLKSGTLIIEEFTCAAENGSLKGKINAIVDDNTPLVVNLDLHW